MFANVFLQQDCHHNFLENEEAALVRAAGGGCGGKCYSVCAVSSRPHQGITVAQLWLFALGWICVCVGVSECLCWERERGGRQQACELSWGLPNYFTPALNTEEAGEAACGARETAALWTAAPGVTQSVSLFSTRHSRFRFPAQDCPKVGAWKEGGSRWVGGTELSKYCSTCG